jgi:ABC-2 type transport system permease protein
MTAITRDPAPVTASSLPAGRQPQRVTQARVTRAEWTKLRTQPSAWWSLLSAVTLVAGFGIGYSLLLAARPPHGAAAIASFDPAAISLSGVQLAQIAAGVLGILLITSEYATGLIRTTFAAVPRRLPVLWAKAALLTAAITAVSLPAAFAAFAGGQSILARQHLSVPLSQPGVTRAVIGSALYLAAISLLGLGLGALTRNAAGGIAALFGILYGLTLTAALLPASIAADITKYLPATAGQAITTVQPDPTTLQPWTGFAVLCAYAAVLLSIAAVRIRRGDA